MSLLYYDPVLSDREHEEVLLGLSLARAEVIRDLLVGYGAPASRFTLNSWGKLRPLVPFDNLDERSIDRRVEFDLQR